MQLNRRTLLAGALAVGAAGVAAPFILRSSRRPRLRLASSIYVGWMPWFYAAESGLLAKIAAAHGVEIEFVRGDYADTISLFGAGAVDAVTMTNIDAAPAIVSANIQADAVLPGSFSNGNDAIMMRPPARPLAGSRLGLVQYSVSHYLLDRVLEKKGIPFDQVRLVNLADSAIISSYVNRNNDLDGVVTWNPLVDELERRHGAVRVADSRAIPYEIADMLVVNRASRKKAPQFVRALLETWFAVTSEMRANPKKMDAVLGRLSGTDAAGYRRQLDDTILSDTPQKALAVFKAGKLAASAPFVKAFALRHKLVEKPPRRWMTFGDEEPGALHFDARPLRALLAAKTPQSIPAAAGTNGR